ncbi:MAG TPA: hypothetical protein VNF74_11370 [Terriglobales bacterium]|nr:hypothetical protein [Terriglobales bacterium]
MTTQPQLGDPAAGMAQPPQAQPLAGDQRAMADAARSAPAANRAEQPTPEAPLLGPDPPEALQAALREMVRGYELESDAVRRHKVRLWREAEEFWRGNQNIWFSAKDSNWHTPFERDDVDRSDLPRYDYAINMYRPWGLSIIAALVQAPPKIQYMPVSAESQDDIATAKAAERVAEVVESNNKMQTLRVKMGYYLWNQGLFATYTRFVVDAGQFGSHEEPVSEEQTFQVLPNRLECQACGGSQPADQPAEGAASAAGTQPCATCGAPLGPESFAPAEHITANVPTGTRRVPNGAEKISVYGPLYFKVPPQAQDQRDCYYLIHVEEQHKAVLRAAYPQKADKIDDTGGSGEDTYERIVRLSLADAQGSWNTLPMSNLITYKRCWLRPEAFWAHADAATRAQLLQMYPEGCRVEFAGDTFLQAVAERLDDCWVICTGLPGVGIYRDAMGQDAISIQRQINDSANILAEHREMSSAPPILYDARFINGEALAKKRMQPASYVPVIIESVGPQKPMAEMIFQPRLGVDPALWNDGERLAEAGQFITGALPSIFGGGIPNLKTAAAYSQSRDQAMGRLTLVWKQMREAEARQMTLAIECFRRNRTDDVELVVEGKSGGYRSEYIRLGEIRGNVVARPTADEDFPQSFGQIRESLQQILQTKDPEMLAVVAAPVNRPIVQQYMGLPELVDPGEDNRAKQYMEIESLMGSAPTAGPNGQVQPSIAPDLYVDDHEVHIATIKDWAVSEPGLQAKISQPQGYANVIAHLLAHMDAEQALAEQMQQRRAQVQNAGQAPAGAGPAAAPAPARPSEAINFKDVAAFSPAAGNAMLQQAGLPTPAPPPAQPQGATTHG